MAPEDYEVFAHDLLGFPLDEIEEGLELLGKKPREEGQTAFPDAYTLLDAVKRVGPRRRMVARQEEDRKREEAEERHRLEHPEDYVWTEREKEQMGALLEKVSAKVVMP